MTNDNDNMQAELDARIMKIEYLEKKLEEKYHLESLVTQLKEDYEELRKDKHELLTQSEQRILVKSDELKKSMEDRDEVLLT